MSEWKPRRFWKEAHAVALEGGFEVQLDGRPLRTPAKAPMLLPSRALALAVAAEWNAQEGELDPLSMPLTRTANSAVDTVAQNRAAIEEMIAAYGGTDLLCYRADAPQELVDRQQASWDPLLSWAAAELGAPLTVTAGILPVEQPAQSLERLAAELAALSHFELAAVHELVALSGSLVLGLAVLRGRIAATDAWDSSRIDEAFQIDQWGADDEAEKLTQRKGEAFRQAAALLELCRAG